MRTYSILYVEDHSSLREIGRISLELFGLFEVDVAFDPAEAVRKAGRKPYDAILMDLRLPDLRGRAKPSEMLGIRAIKQVRQFSDVLIVVISAYSDAKTRRKAHQAGATLFKSKPVDWLVFAPELAGMIERHADNRTTLPEHFRGIPHVGKTPNVFCSYARQDSECLIQLDSYLRPLERQGVLALWDDRDVSAGQDFAREIAGRLAGADLVLLLVSPDYLGSDVCYDQYVAAIKRADSSKAVVVPILIRPADWRNTTFGQLAPLPADGKPVSSWSNKDEAWLHIVQGVRFVAMELKGDGVG